MTTAVEPTDPAALAAAEARAQHLKEMREKAYARLIRPLLAKDESTKVSGQSEEEQANIISRAFLLFLNPLMRKAEELDSNMEIEDLDLPPTECTAKICHDEFTKLWEEECKKPADQRGLIGVCFRFIGPYLPTLCIAIVFATAAPFCGIVLLGVVANFLNDPKQPLWVAGVVSVAYFLAQVIYTIASAQISRAICFMSNRLMAALRVAVARKIIAMRPGQTAASGGPGVMFQVFTSSLFEVAMVLPQCFMILQTILQVLAAFAYLFAIIGWPVIAGVAVFLIVLPINYNIANSFLGLYFAKMGAGEARTKKVVEVINNIKAVKLYGWGQSMRQVVAALREPELAMTYVLLQRIAMIICSFSIAAPMVQVAIFVVLVAVYPSFTGAVLFFQSLGLISMLSLAMIVLPFFYSQLLQIQVAKTRVQDLLSVCTEELPPTTPEAAAAAGYEQDDAIFLHGKFSQPAPPAPPAPPASSEPAAAAAPPAPPTGPVMETATPFRAKTGELVMVVGKLGSGKSTLINSIIGDVPPQAGSSWRVNSTKVAYIPQNPWIINATVRNNICMELPYDEERYAEVIDAVEMGVDLGTLANGDLTEIGEKGINLSGGQKQRLSIARALYSGSDIYLFDDPLSALDAHVGRNVFERGICNLLRGKTRVLVTNQMQYLSSASRVFVFDAMKLTEAPMPLPNAAQIAAAGESSTSPLIQLLRAWSQSSESPSATPPGTPRKGRSPTTASPTSAHPSGVFKAASRVIEQKKFSPEAGKLTVQEERQSGQVSSGTFLTYLGSFGGFFFWVFLIFLQLLSNGCELFSRIWMGLWASGQLKSLEAKYPSGFFLGIYAAGIVAAAIVVFGRETMWRSGAITAPRTLYDRMMNAVVNSPMMFFDTTPTGRILNRFTRDSETLDFALPMAAGQVVSLFFAQLAALASICYYVPYFTPIAVVFLVSLLFIQPTVATVVLRRISSSSVGPVMALLSEVVSGSSSIRVLKLNDFYVERFYRSVDDNTSAQRPDTLLLEAVRVRVNLVMALVQFGLILTIMASRGSLDAGFSAFVITQVINVSMFIGFMMQQRGNLALSLNSVERMVEYIALPPEITGTMEAPAQWPKEGRVELKQVCAKYRPDLPNALTDLTLTIQPGQKVGVVGRTGSGKSSTLLTLFRLIPVTGGAIEIDGVDTATLPVEALRGALAAIPQEPVLFSATIRNNLDPFQQRSDPDLLAALKTCHIYDAIHTKVAEADKEKENAVLDVVIKDGSELSVGEKQLLCLARAVARGSKIIVLDEATSSVDPHTDAIIQKTIRTSFVGCTVITVAHRINTILDSDVIVVLDQGRLAEMGPPQALIETDGIFASLVANSNGESAPSPM